MIAALAYQESGIDQSKRSPAGAIGVMQLLPSTAADPNVWFRNVEIIAARGIGRETVQHVSNIYKYYIAHRSIIRDIKSKKEKKFERIECKDLFN
jgi:membrane-bound lytic murein transglycosylase MltF